MSEKPEQVSEKPVQKPDDGADRPTSRGEALRRLGVGAVGVAAGAALAGARDAQAADGGNFILGQSNTSESQTSLTSSNASTTSGSDAGLSVVAASTNFGVDATSSLVGVAGSGVFGLAGGGTVGAFLSGADVPLSLDPLASAGPRSRRSRSPETLPSTRAAFSGCASSVAAVETAAPRWAPGSRSRTAACAICLRQRAPTIAATTQPASRQHGLAPHGEHHMVVTSIPSAAVGIVGNLAVTQENNNGFATIWPSGAWPGTANINFQPGVDLSNSVAVALSGGTVQVASSSPTHVVIDVAGYIL